MALLVPNAGETDALSFFVAKSNATNLILKLYTNNISPGETDVAGTYTEAAGNGYTALTMNGANWTVTAGAPSLAEYAQQTFTFTGALGLVYGYFMVRATSGTIAYGERFTDGPYNVTANGDQIKITPKITFD